MPEQPAVRREDDASGLLAPGEISKMTRPHPRTGKPYFIICSPNGHGGSLAGHDVTEHEDGTITVEPSILISNHTGELFHGWLRAGVWSW